LTESNFFSFEIFDGTQRDLAMSWKWEFGARNITQIQNCPRNCRWESIR